MRLDTDEDLSPREIEFQERYAANEKTTGKSREANIN